jgi:NAD(P)-dependent dehydrogenase (short-subunit alcohol dehydrogenase family)
VRINTLVVGGMQTPQAERTRAAITAQVGGSDADAPAPTPPPRRNPLVYEPLEVARVARPPLQRRRALVTGATIEVDHAMTAGSMASTLIYMTSAGIWQKSY